MGSLNARPPSDQLLARQRELNRKWDEQRQALHLYSDVIHLPQLPPLPRYGTNAIGIPLIRAAIEEGK